MSEYVKRFERNQAGRDLVIGDIHGHFTKAREALDAIGFDPERDRLFSVGDMVDRGPESEACLDWLAQPWFHAVCGNHETLTLAYHRGDPDSRGMLAMNGGAWMLGKTPAERLQFVDAFNGLPVAIELETEQGLVGIVHADCPSPQWSMFRARLEMGGDVAAAAADGAMWSRRRIDFGEEHGVPDMRAVIVGHTPVQEWTSLDNVLYIDTLGWKGKPFTILDAATLRPAVKP